MNLVIGDRIKFTLPKFTGGSFSFSGIRHAAKSLDTLWGVARCVRDVDLLRVVLAGREPIPPEGSRPRAVGLCLTAVWEKVEEPMRAAVESAARELQGLGVRVVDAELPPVCDELLPAQAAIMLFEIARVFTYERIHHREALSPGFQALLDAGAGIDPSEYDRARLLAGNRLRGPAIVTEMDSTTLILSDHVGVVDERANILIRPQES